MGLIRCLVDEGMVGETDGVGGLAVLLLVWTGGWFVSKFICEVNFSLLWGGLEGGRLNCW